MVLQANKTYRNVVVPIQYTVLGSCQSEDLKPKNVYVIRVQKNANKVVLRTETEITNMFSSPIDTTNCQINGWFLTHALSTAIISSGDYYNSFDLGAKSNPIAFSQLNFNTGLARQGFVTFDVHMYVNLGKDGIVFW